MKNSALLLSLAFALIAGGLTACSDSDNDSEQNQGGEQSIKPKLIKSALQRADSDISEANLDAFVKGQYDLNFDLLRASADQINDDNAMISTFSIQMALAMTWAGANGDTASEMADALHFDSHTHDALNKIDALIRSKNKPAIDSEFEKRDAVEIATNNDMYFSPDKYTWSSDWLNTLAVNYGAGIQEMRFSADPEAARKYINGVIAEDTHDRIRDLLPEDSIVAETQSVITNAIYFKAPWDGEVSKASDKLSFHKQDGASVDVDYLKTSGHLAYMADVNNQFQAVSVPLRDNDFKVMFILPADGQFSALQSNLSSDVVGNILDGLSQEALVNLDFPSYSFETSLALKEPLKALGMNKAFESDADFSKMTNEENGLSISDVYHKTFVGLDDNGVEAAAATAVVSPGSAIPVEDVVNVALDRPYFFVIYESQSQSPLFVGRVMDPSAK